MGETFPVERAASRSAKGSGCSGHLIHRGAVPLPLEGKDNTHSNYGLTCYVGRSIAYCLLPIAFREAGARSPVPGHWSLVSPSKITSVISESRKPKTGVK